jgi:hypothetical protein
MRLQGEDFNLISLASTVQYRQHCNALRIIFRLVALLNVTRKKLGIWSYFLLKVNRKGQMACGQ